MNGEIPLCGGIDVQYVIVNNTTEQIDPGMKLLIDFVDGLDGELTIAPENSIIPETQLETSRNWLE